MSRHTPSAFPLRPLGRRALLQSLAAAAALPATAGAVFAQAKSSAGASAGSAASTAPPARPRQIILKGAQILTMKEGDPALHRADLRIRDGIIVEMSEGIELEDADSIDLSGHLLMPGLVDTHWHMWNSIARGMARTELGGFSESMKALSPVWTPEAAALSVRMAIAEAWSSGITTVHNWAHNTLSIDFAEAELGAMRELGIRGRYSYGYPQSLKPDQRMDFDALEAFHKAQFGGAETDDRGLLTMGLCTRGPDRSDEKIWQEEWEFARSLGLPVTAHVASTAEGAAQGNLQKMGRGGYLGPDVQIVHATHASDDDFALLAETGTQLSISPWTELEVGYGLPPVARMVKAGLQPGLSVDNTTLAGNADMFSVMKLTADLAAGETGTQNKIPDRQVLGWATRMGAQSLGFGKMAGQIAAGWRADLIGLNLEAINLQPAYGTAFALTHAARPGNVDFVMSDGEIRKRDGRLVGLNEAALVAQAQEMIDGLWKTARANAEATAQDAQDAQGGDTGTDAADKDSAQGG